VVVLGVDVGIVCLVLFCVVFSYLVLSYIAGLLSGRSFERERERIQKGRLGGRERERNPASPSISFSVLLELLK
jgi:hypothetical protein